MGWCSMLRTNSSKGIGDTHTMISNLKNEPVAAASATPAEKYEYPPEVSRLMDLIVNCSYSDKGVFLEELTRNASDALYEQVGFFRAADPQLLQNDTTDLDIRIWTDKDKGIITITDTGIGMTRQELVDCLVGTLAQTGTPECLIRMRDKEANHLLCWGGKGGFYSAFLVSEGVSTKSPKSDKQYVWEGEANSRSYTIREETDPAKLIPRGTRVTLYLKHDEKGFAHPKRIKQFVKNEQHFVRFTIYTWQKKGYSKVKVDHINIWDTIRKEIIERNRKGIASFLRFFSSHSYLHKISLDEYVESTKPEQKDIYYIAADSVASARSTPILEKFIEKDIEVLFIVNPEDKVAIQNQKSYKDKNFVDISRENLDLVVIPEIAVSSAAASTTPAEKYEYQLKVWRLMNCIVNWPRRDYRDKEVFLMELVRNASNAMDKLCVVEPQIFQNATTDLAIGILTDYDNGIITIRDFGIGMTRQELIDCLVGTLAQTGTPECLLRMMDRENPYNSNWCDKAGFYNSFYRCGKAGFYSAFLVSERVEVSTKSPNSDKQYVWESEANSRFYTIREETDPAKLIPRGTRVTLYLKHDDRGYAYPVRAAEFVKYFQPYIPFPIYTRISKVNYTRFLKLADTEDHENHKRIDPFPRFFSSHSYGDTISLDEYVDKIEPLREDDEREQKNIYYITADSVASARSMPILEKFIQLDIEVLFVVNPEDEVAIQNQKSYRDMNFVEISKENFDLGLFPEIAALLDSERQSEYFGNVLMAYNLMKGVDCKKKEIARLEEDTPRKTEEIARLEEGIARLEEEIAPLVEEVARMEAFHADLKAQQQVLIQKFSLRGT